MRLKKLIAAVERFVPHHDGNDEVWRFRLSVRNRWQTMAVRRYDSVHYFGIDPDRSFNTSDDSSSAISDDEITNWIDALKSWHADLRSDPLEAQARLNRRIPVTQRRGVIQRSNVRRILPEWCDFEKELGDVTLRDLEGILTAFRPDPHGQMTLKLYLEYCRIAYEANSQTLSQGSFQSGLTGREYYRRFADGRDGGLLQLPEDSSEEFSKWYQSDSWAGCHPWEIYRGGNSTHIDLAVVSEHGRGWQVQLHAFSSTRLAEACRIAHALHENGMPVDIVDKESYLARLRNEDWIGIVPEGHGINYSWHDFPRELKVADCLYFNWLLEEKPPAQRATLRRQLKNLIQWLPMRYSCAIR